MWDLIVSVPDHCLSFYFLDLFSPEINILVPYVSKPLREPNQLINLSTNSQSDLDRSK